MFDVSVWFAFWLDWVSFDLLTGLYLNDFALRFVNYYFLLLRIDLIWVWVCFVSFGSFRGWFAYCLLLCDC